MILPYIFDDFTTTYRHWCACKIGVYNITSRSTATKDHCTLRLYDCKCSIDFIKNDVFSNENSIHETNIAGLELWFPEENMHQSINIYIYIHAFDIQYPCPGSHASFIYIHLPCWNSGQLSKVTTIAPLHQPRSTVPNLYITGYSYETIMTCQNSLNMLRTRRPVGPKKCGSKFQKKTSQLCQVTLHWFPSWRW